MLATWFTFTFTFTFSHLADSFIQSDLQMSAMEAIKINKRVIRKCYSITSIFNYIINQNKTDTIEKDSKIVKC